MHKNGALTVAQTLLSAMGKPRLVNNDSNVCGANERSVGKQNTIISHVLNTGSGYGLSRATRSDYYANCQITAPPSCMASRIIGFNETPRNNLITLRSDI